MDDDTDCVELASDFSHAETVARLKAAIASAGMTLFAEFDHQAGAREAGLEMPPTLVLVYGNPRGGTPIMLAAPRAALDLPLHVLVREEGGRVLVSYHTASALLCRAGVPETLAARLDPAQQLLGKALTSA